MSNRRWKSTLVSNQLARAGACWLALGLPLVAQRVATVNPVLVVHGGVDDAGRGQLSAQDEAAIRAGITRVPHQILKFGKNTVFRVFLSPIHLS